MSLAVRALRFRNCDDPVSFCFLVTGDCGGENEEDGGSLVDSSCGFGLCGANRSWNLRFDNGRPRLYLLQGFRADWLGL